METKAILFDLDGTLTDSGEGILNCAELALRHYGLPIPSREEMRVFVGPPLVETFGKFGVPESEVDNAVEIFRSRYNTIGKFENAPYPGIPELLADLQAQGHKLYVATSKPERTALEVLDHFDLTKYFTMVCGATFDRSRSNKSDVIAYLLAQNGNADSMVMVGDTHFDILGAAAHGIPAIGVSWGYGEVRLMEEAGAKAIAHSVEKLHALLAD